MALIYGPPSPYTLGNYAAIYSLADAASDFTYILNNGNVTLIADRSGNSAVNMMVFPGGTASNTNNPSFSTLAAFGTNDFTVSARVTPTSLTALGWIMGSAPNGFGMKLNTSGSLQSSKVTSADNVASSGVVSNFTDSVVTYVRSGTTGTYYINGVSAGVVTDNQNYTVGVSVLGTTNTVAANVLNGLMAWTRVYSVALTAPQVVSDAAGTVQSNCVFNVDFTVQAKLVSSFTATTGGTITINTSGDLGARICGARDLVQLTAAKMPAFSVVGGYNTATFDGSNDYMKSAAFSYSQPESVYIACSNVTWAGSTNISDGNTGDSMDIFRRAASGTPSIDLYAGAFGPSNTTLPVGTKGIVRAIFNGASSALGINLGSAITGNTGTSAGNGFSLAISSSLNPVTCANITFSEALLRSVADDATTQLRIAGFLMRRWGILFS